ncbi:RNA 2',3'-cyclic phosphodiesterase [Candidatus Woesearchaeota archaeon]|nr:RNA 2',3'-cyclic phosphodiesterase [Candidatus Woesearchaeota archaeon]
MRLFISVLVSKEVENYLKEIQKLFSNSGDFKFTKSFHITLKFLGWVDDNKLKHIDSLLKEITYNSFELQLNNLGVFPSPSSARVLWVDAIGSINGLQKQIELKLKKEFGEETRFKSHITLAMIKKINDKGKFKELLSKVNIKSLKFQVSDFRLVKSELRITGPIYTDLASYKLK